MTRCALGRHSALSVTRCSSSWRAAVSRRIASSSPSLWNQPIEWNTAGSSTLWIRVRLPGAPGSCRSTSASCRAVSRKASTWPGRTRHDVRVHGRSMATFCRATPGGEPGRGGRRRPQARRRLALIGVRRRGAMNVRRLRGVRVRLAPPGHERTPVARSPRTSSAGGPRTIPHKDGPRTFSHKGCHKRPSARADRQNRPGTLGPPGPPAAAATAASSASESEIAPANWAL